MNTDKLTRRQRYTVNALKDSYIDLLREMPSEHITIVSLCQHADINRTTFYRYFNSLDELMDEMVADLFRDIFAVLKVGPLNSPNGARKQILQTLNTIQKNKKLCKLLLCEKHSLMVEKVLAENLLVIREAIQGTGCTEDEVKICYSYFCGGMANLWVQWVENDFSPSKEKLAIIIEGMIIGFYDKMASGFIMEKP